jgi:SAM-dependent methyltransferase
MPDHSARGTASLWGPRFGRGARTWASTWEGESGWGNAAYEYVADATDIGRGSQVLDCGCGAGRFAALAAARGADVAGLDAAAEMIEIAAERVPDADLRVGDLESLPWSDDEFDLVTGFSSFQFAQDKTRALSEAKRTSRAEVAVVIPVLSGHAGIAEVLHPVLPLFPDDDLETLRESGIFSLSGPDQLDERLDGVGLTVRHDAEIDGSISFADMPTAVSAFMDAGPVALAIDYSGSGTVASAVREGLARFESDEGLRVPGVFRVVIASK